MCGIVGIFDLKGNSISKQVLKRMANAIDYRGPDDEGYYVDSNVGLGHKRLSIIDLSKKGKQPMCNEEGDVWIVYNGEIYNFRELREELERKGHKFKSSTDTEVIIHAYEEYGEKCLRNFNGMFSFAVYDLRKIKGKRNQKLFLARDRLGQKPLAYYHDKKRFVFASEIKSLLQNKDVKKDISTKAISYYLTFGYIPAPLSIFKGIKKLKPGHYLIVEKGSIKEKKYWDISYNNKSRQLNENAYARIVLEELERATKARLVSDVPLGAFLSGGIDSSAVVAMMAKHSDNVRTFSIGFEEGQYNELKFARIIAEKFDTEHKELIVSPKMTDMLPKLVWNYNEPYADSSALPSYYVAKMTRKYVTVALNGDGGDESFGGYGKYAVDNFVDYYKKIPGIARKPFGIANALKKANLFRDIIIIRRMGDFHDMTKLSSKQRFMKLTFHFGSREKKEILAKPFPKKEIDVPYRLFENYYNKKGLDNLHKKIYFDVKNFLPYDLLVKMDIATMANSLEGRSPFLDVNVVEMASSMPSSMKVRGLTKKYILKKALANVLPKKILTKKKQGFSVPAETWFRKDLKGFTYDLLLGKDTMISSYVKQDKIKKLLDQHASGQNHKSKIWNLVCLELWHRVYIQNKGKEPNKGLYGVL